MFEESSRNHEGVAAVVQDRPQARTPREDGRGGEPAYALGRLPGTRQETAWQKVKNFRVEIGPGRKDILNFTNQLPVMVRAGISLQVVITDLKNRIDAGQSFSQALAEHPQVFSDLYINMVAAAEISGSLSGMLQKLVEYLDSEAETRSQV